jgi:hypothetical protein
MLKANPKMAFLIFNELHTNSSRLNLFKEQIGTIPRSLLLQMEAELKVEIEKGAVRPMSAADLILTILSLNLMMFLAGPVLIAMTGMTETEFQNLLENRKRENVTVILKSLRP